jgi:hypothetical protein
MVIYRIEDNNQKGPFRSDVAYSLSDSEDYQEKTIFHRKVYSNPPPQEDNIGSPSSYEKCGCEYISQLFDNWNFHLLPTLTQKGYHISVYKIQFPDKVKTGKIQIVFNPQYASLLFTISIPLGFELYRKEKSK